MGSAFLKLLPHLPHLYRCMRNLFALIPPSSIHDFFSCMAILSLHVGHSTVWPFNVGMVTPTPRLLLRLRLHCRVLLLWAFFFFSYFGNVDSNTTTTYNLCRFSHGVLHFSHFDGKTQRVSLGQYFIPAFAKPSLLLSRIAVCISISCFLGSWGLEGRLYFSSLQIWHMSRLINSLAFCNPLRSVWTQ